MRFISFLVESSMLVSPYKCYLGLQRHFFNWCFLWTWRVFFSSKVFSRNIVAMSQILISLYNLATSHHCMYIFSVIFKKYSNIALFWGMIYKGKNNNSIYLILHAMSPSYIMLYWESKKDIFCHIILMPMGWDGENNIDFNMEYLFILCMYFKCTTVFHINII